MAINDPTAQYAQALRKRQEAAQARASGQRFRGLAESAPTSGVVGGGSVGGQPAPAMVDWGSIIQRGVGNYQAAKGETQANKLDAEAEELNQQFMLSTIGDDPEAQRLMQMAQAGVPGAEEALAQKINPKKEALAGLLQGIASGQLTPEIGAEIAPQYGLNPELVASAIQSQQARTMQAAEMDFQQKMALRNTPQARATGGAAAPRGPAAKGGVSFEQYEAMTPEQREAYEKYIGSTGRGSTTAGLTPGERNERAKTMKKLDDDLLKMNQQMGKFDNLRSRMNNPDVFGGKQKTAQILSEYGDVPGLGPLLGGLGTAMRSEEFMLLEDYLNSETLSRMAALGGNDSNEELRRMRASLPTVMNNQEAALALLDQLDSWQRRTESAVRSQRDQIKTGEYFNMEEASPNYFQQAPVPEPHPASVAPQAQPPQSQPMAAPEPPPVQAAPEVPPMLAPMAPAPFTTPSGIKIRIKQ